MSRLGWLVLLISLGVNLGLGYRLFVDRPVPESREFTDRHGRWGDGPSPQGGGERDGKGMRGRNPGERRWRDRDDRPALADSTRMRRVMKHRMEALARRLELSEEQRASLEELHRKNGRRIIDQRIRVEAARATLMNILADAEPRTEEVREAVHQVGRQEATLDSLITESLLEEMEFLNPDQRSRYLRFLPGMEDHRPGSRRGRPGRDVPPPPED